MPIQQVLDTAPLPFTPNEFQAMPKTPCASCLEHIPLQLFSVHVEMCSNTPRGDETYHEIIYLEDDTAVTDTAVDSGVMISVNPVDSAVSASSSPAASQIALIRHFKVPRRQDGQKQNF